MSHQLHHAHLNEDEDADLLFGRPDESTRKLVLMCLQDLLMITAAKRLLQYMQTDRRTYDHRPWERLTVRFFADRVGMMVPIAAAQMLMVVYYWLVIGPEFYVYFYALPLATLYPAQIRLRSACEHSFEVGYDVASDGRWVSRSTNANVLERFLIGPLCSDYHFEHHLLPAVPYYNLPLVRQLLVDKGLQVPVSAGYVGYLVRRWRQERTLACMNSPAHYSSTYSRGAAAGGPAGRSHRPSFQSENSHFVIEWACGRGTRPWRSCRRWLVPM